jgi:hypothetical protein
LSLFPDLRRWNLDLIKEIGENIDIIHKASFRDKVDVSTAGEQITETCSLWHKRTKENGMTEVKCEYTR